MKNIYAGWEGQNKIMANMQPKKTSIPETSADKRIKNFCEVTLGYTEDMAINEANRCLKCKNKPCVAGCPVNVNIPEFIEKICEKNFTEAYNIIKDTNSLPGVCGRVCPQERQCEVKCVRGIKNEPVGIGRLERFAADYAAKSSDTIFKSPQKNNIKTAVIGSGPAALSCAGDLLKFGYDVTIFEALHAPGGVLRYGIPEFRLPRNILDNEINQLKKMGADLKLNTVIGKTIFIEELFEMEYKAIFVGTGAGLPRFMNIPGEGLMEVYSANEFLTRINLMKAYDDRFDTPIINIKNVAVIGGGNVAMDAARCALRLGAKSVNIIYRREMEQIPARKEEIHHAMEEGVSFKFLTNPVKIIGDEQGHVKGIECIKMKLGEPDESGRQSPSVIENSNFSFECDTVIIAIGNLPNPLVSSSYPEIKTNQKGCIVADEETFKTSVNGIYAGGDIVTGAATVILAMGAGKKAAAAMHEYLK